MAKPLNAGSSTLPAPERQISGYLSTFDSRKLNCLEFLLVISLEHFVIRSSAGSPHYCLRGLVGLVVGLAIGDAVSMAGKVAVVLSGWSL